MWKDEPAVIRLLRKVVEQARDGHVVEMGSFAMHDHDARPMFPGRRFVGVDARPGPGVDIVSRSIDLEASPRWEEVKGAAVALSISALEHDPWVSETVGVLMRSLAPGGIAALTFPLDPWIPHELDCAPLDEDYYRNPTVAEVLMAIADSEVDILKLETWQTLNGSRPDFPRAHVMVTLPR